MKSSITILILFLSTTLYCQYSHVDTMIWKHNAGHRSEMFHFDSSFVESLIEVVETSGCDTIVDFLHRSHGELGKYDGFVNGFSDEIRIYAFKLSILRSKCLTEVLDNYAVPAKFIYAEFSDPTNASKYPFLKEVQNNIHDYLPVLRKVLIATNYQFKFRNDSDIYLRKSSALLLNRVARSITPSQLDLLKESRKEYVNSLLLDQYEIEKIKDPSSKFPMKL